MLRLKNFIRLHAADKQYLSHLTGVVPSLGTVQQMNNFLQQQIKLHNQDTPEAKLICMLLEDHLIQDRSNP